MTEREGGKNRKIELGMKVSEERMAETEGSTRTQMFSKRRTISFQFNNCLFVSYNFPFYRNKRREVTARHRGG